MIVPSAFVRDRAVARLGLDPARVRVVHHGVDHELFRPGDERARAVPALPGAAWPHKNHALLFAAFALVRRERPELELVLTGGGHEALALPPGVRSLGNVPVAELAALYRRAAALVFPSRYEGFGSPVLEAMASGCPVAAAAGDARSRRSPAAPRCSSTPDVAGGDRGGHPAQRSPRRPRCAARGIERAARVHAGSGRPARTTRSTRARALDV